jgi:hypothetical protein
MKKKSSSKKFESQSEMDRALETNDLSKDFKEKGIVKKPHIRKINLDLPEGIVEQIDRIAEKVGVSRQPLLKIWIHERLKEENVE